MTLTEQAKQAWNRVLNTFIYAKRKTKGISAAP